jgi:PPE-repeat protein
LYIDYGLLPPEINSGRMYAGPGPGSMLAAAAAWDKLAAELHSTAAAYGSVVTGLAGGPWVGPASAAMARAAQSYVTWLHSTAAQADQAASQATATVDAHSAALAATVPPPVIAANRALLLHLISTNFLGQNTPAIGATEGQYSEMWAQDAAAMYGYADASATASRLSPFNSPPQTTNPGGQATQAASVAQTTGAAAGTSAHSTLAQLMSSLSTTQSSLTSSAPSGTSGLSGPSSTAGEFANLSALPSQGLGNVTSFYSDAADLVSNFNNGIGLTKFLAQNPGLALSAPLTGPVLTSSTGGVGMSAGLGQALKIGAVSVPPGWAMPAPAVNPVALALPAGSPVAVTALVDGIPGGAFSETMLGTLAGRGLGGLSARAVVSRHRKVVTGSPAAG